MKNNKWLKRYNNATELMQRGRIKEAKKELEELVLMDDGISNNDISAAYVCLGSCYQNSDSRNLEQIRSNAKKAEKCAKKALEKNKDNKLAPTLLVRSLFPQEQYYEACEILAKYNIDYESAPDMVYNSGASNWQNKMAKRMEMGIINTAIVRESAKDKDFFESLLDIHYKYEDSVNYTLVIINAAMTAGYYLEASKLIYNCLSKDNVDRLTVDAKINLVSEEVLCCSFIGGKREIKRSIVKLDELLDEYGEDIGEERRQIVLNNKLTGLAKIGDVEQVSMIIKDLPDSYKDNTLMYNMAKACLDLGRYDEALRLGWCAIQTKKDECDYILLGRSYMGIEQYENAIDMFKKAVGFIDANKEMSYHIDDITVESIASETKEERVSAVYKYLIQAYVANDEYEYAEAALERFKDSSDNISLVADSELLLRIEKKVADRIDDIKQAYDNLSAELERKDKENSVLKKNMEDWYTKLYQCQRIDATNIISDSEWDEEMSAKMDDIVQSVSCYCFKKKSEYKSIENGINKRFPELTKTTRNFLSTAEQIYVTFEKEEMIDFAPVMVEYSRFIETLLWEYINNSSEYRELGEKSKMYHNQGETLGAATHVISKKGGTLYRFYKKIDWIRDNRNRSAHINVSREPDVTEIRRYIWESELVDVLCENDK